MSKNKLPKKYDKIEEEDDFDVSEMMGLPYDDEAVAGVMHALIEASNNQIALAMELTELVISKNADKTMSEDDIFSVFKKSSKVIAENFPLKALWDNFSKSDVA